MSTGVRVLRVAITATSFSKPTLYEHQVCDRLAVLYPAIPVFALSGVHDSVHDSHDSVHEAHNTVCTDRIAWYPAHFAVRVRAGLGCEVGLPVMWDLVSGRAQQHDALHLRLALLRRAGFALPCLILSVDADGICAMRMQTAAKLRAFSALCRHLPHSGSDRHRTGVDS